MNDDRHEPIPVIEPAEPIPAKPRKISLLAAFGIPFAAITIGAIPVALIARVFALSDRALVGIVQVTGVLVPTIWLFRHYGISMSEQIAVRKFRLSHAAPLIVFLLGFAAMMDTITYKVIEVLPDKIAESLRGLLEAQAKLMEMHGVLDWVWFIAVVVIGAGVFEELLFRGLILRASLQRMSIGPAAALNGLLFAFMHLNGPAIPYYFLLGMSLAIIVHRTGCLAYTMMLHGMLNLISGLLYYKYGLEPSLPFSDIVVVIGGFVVMAIGFGLFLLVSRRKPEPVDG